MAKKSEQRMHSVRMMLLCNKSLSELTPDELVEMASDTSLTSGVFLAIEREIIRRMETRNGKPS